MRVGARSMRRSVVFKAFIVTFIKISLMMTFVGNRVIYNEVDVNKLWTLYRHRMSPLGIAVTWSQHIIINNHMTDYTTFSFKEQNVSVLNAWNYSCLRKCTYANILGIPIHKVDHVLIDVNVPTYRLTGLRSNTPSVANLFFYFNRVVTVSS